MPDGTVKTIGPTATAFTHYWRIVAVLENGKTEIFWGHAKSLADATLERSLQIAEFAKNDGLLTLGLDLAKLPHEPRHLGRVLLDVGQ